MNTSWISPSQFPALSENEIQIWRIKTDEISFDWKLCEFFLSDDEKEKVRRFAFEKDRSVYAVSHCLLRLILSEILWRNHRKIIFVKNEYGKPSVLNLYFEPLVKFNLSHSNYGVLIGIMVNHQIGVDLEFHRSGFNILEVADHFFSKIEIDSLKALPEHLQETGFYNCWTRKEAYIKAKGEGLSIPLNRFSVTLNPIIKPRLIEVINKPDEPNNWVLKTFNPWADYTAAVCYEGEFSNFSYFDSEEYLCNKIHKNTL